MKNRKGKYEKKLKLKKKTQYRKPNNGKLIIDKLKMRN